MPDDSVPDDAAVFVDTAAAHGITALDAISTAIAGKPWLPAALCQLMPIHGLP